MAKFETFKKLNMEEKFNLFEQVYQQNIKLNNLLKIIAMKAGCAKWNKQTQKFSQESISLKTSTTGVFRLKY